MIYNDLVGGFNPSEKYESQIGSSSQLSGKIKLMFHTTNQDIELKFGSSRFHMKFLSPVTCKNRWTNWFCLKMGYTPNDS